VIIPAAVSDEERLVTEWSVERCLDWLRDNAAAIGAAKREAVYRDHMVRVTKALEMKRHSDMPVSRAEIEALTSDAYARAILEDARAAGEYERLVGLRRAAEARIEAWRSEQANYRAMKL
jgi:hypothetical protein